METNSQRDIAGLPTRVENVITVLDLSVCIVTYKARDMLKNCLQSLYENSSKLNLEVIVSDNSSEDGTVEMLQQEFPEVYIIKNGRNLGFAKPMNQALRASQGNYALLLNPDTIVLPHAFDRLIDFMGSHPGVGICGPKVLNSDYTLQKPCRRGESRPWAVISYFTGLARLFPKSRFFGEYLMSYKDENETHAVAGVAGSCMLIRRELFDQIGYLDELFFAYQEDADYCHRARQAGWKVYYLPEAQIIHYGGQGGSRVDPYRSIIEWHKSYWLYYRKNLASDYFFLFNWVYYLAMLVKLSSALLINFFRSEKFAGPRRKI